MSFAELWRKQFLWRRLFQPLDKLPPWAGYLFAILCSGAIGYSLGSTRWSLWDPRQGQIMLVIVAAGAAFLLVFILDLTLRLEERRRVERAEQLRLGKEAAAVQLLDPVDRDVLYALDEIASVKGVDRATLIPAVLHQYVARKSFEAALREHAARSKTSSSAEPEAPPGWSKTLPAWLETLPGSLDVKSQPHPVRPN